MPWETLRFPGQRSKMVFHEDPHYEEDLSTETGGLMFFVQYTGPSTGQGPIYDGRFNMAERKPLSEEI